VHVIDWFRAMCGDARDVHAVFGPQHDPRYGFRDIVHATFRFHSGAVATISGGLSFPLHAFRESQGPWGEATTEHHELAIKAHVESELRARLLGMDPAAIERVWQLDFREFWWRRGVVHGSAMSGIDQALWDIAGKAAGLPVFKLLGGRVRERVRCYIRSGPEFYGVELEDAARRAREMGFDAFKHGFGSVTRPFDARRHAEVAVAEVRRLRQVFGDETALMIDAAGMFDPQAAHLLLQGPPAQPPGRVTRQRG